ncbi:MAG: ATP-binding protein [Vulcanimicrobiota bacterium]
MNCNTDESPFNHREVLIMMLEHLLQKGSLPDDLPVSGEKDERLLELLRQLELISQAAQKISKGDLSGELPVKGAIAGSVKALQASLRHLTWQAERIAQGDLSQRVDFMGDFSMAFNHMTEQLTQTREEDKRLCELLEIRATELDREKKSALKLMEEARESRNALAEMNDELQKAIGSARKHASEAEEAHRAKSTILTHISHEIRTPLNGIIGMADLLMTIPLPPVQHEYVVITKNSAIMLLGLLNNVLDYAKLEAGMCELEHCEFNFLKLMEDTIDVVALKAQEKGIEPLLFFYKDVPYFLVGDPIRLSQILINLLGNAVKFTSQGELSLSVKTASALDGNVTLRFEVTDTGPGISPQAQAKIFTPFVQADSSVTSHFGGTGLGLSISRQIVEMMGGSIAVESIEGAGSTFWFTVSFDIPSCSAEPSPPVEYDCSGRRFLIADASASSRRLLRMLIEEWGGAVTDAADEEEILTAVERYGEDVCPYDAIIMASVIINYGASELTDVFEKVSKCRRIPILVLRTLGSHQDNRVFTDIGFDFTMIKPVNRSRFAQSLKHLLDQDSAPVKKGLSSEIPQRLRNLHLRVLVAEDNTVNQKLISALLHMLGCDVDITGNGRDALEALRKESYNIVLMDCQMPFMNGYEATKALREKVYPVRDHNIPVIAMTASVSSEERERCRAAGMSDFLPKPLMMEELAAVLARWSEPEEHPGGTVKTDDAELSSVSFDSKKLLRLFKGDMILARSIVAAFLEDIHDQIESLLKAHRDADISTLILRVHSIKGVSGYIGAQRLFALAETLETKLNTGHEEDMKHLIAEFQQEFNRVKAECEAFLQSGE